MLLEILRLLKIKQFYENWHYRCLKQCVCINYWPSHDCVDIIIQVEQVLTIEGLLPKKLQSRFRHGYQIMQPSQKVETEPSLKDRFLRKVQFTLWGGDKYDTKSALLRALHPHEV